MTLKALSLAVAVIAQPLVDEDVLEPSVQNEVDHALARAPVLIAPASHTNKPFRTTAILPFPTNGMTHTAIAIRLVSEQRTDGRWFNGTNDVTMAAIRLLRAL